MYCTSLYCKSYGSDYCPECSHSRSFGFGLDANGRFWRWESNPYFGPLFLAADWDTPIRRQPGEKSLAWGVFQWWMDKIDYRYLWE